MQPATGAPVRTDFVQVTLVDPRGRVLMQERDEHAPAWADMWCFPGGGLEEGETPVAGAVRELVAPVLRSWIDEHPFDPAPDGRTFTGVVLVDPAGRILLQERDEHAPIDPDRWGLAGGQVEAGEDFETAAYRELEEETGVRLAAGSLALLGEFVVDHTRAHGAWDRMQVFVAATDLTDADIDCREGRQIVFVDPEVARGLDLTAAAADVLPAFLSSRAYASLTP